MQQMPKKGTKIKLNDRNVNWISKIFLFDKNTMTLHLETSDRLT